MEFADAAGYHAAVAANPHLIGGEQIFVEERRPRPNAYGGNFGGRGGMRGGRGNNDGRPGSQGRGGGGGNYPKDGGRGGFMPRGRGGSMTPRGTFHWSLPLLVPFELRQMCREEGVPSDSRQHENCSAKGILL